MKWYSIKKYRPASGAEVLIRALTNQNSKSYDRHFIAMIDSYDSIENLASWELANGGNESFFLNMDDYVVTHFAPLEPVEIEEVKINE
jgi:hypothetical protein